MLILLQHGLLAGSKEVCVNNSFIKREYVTQAGLYKFSRDGSFASICVPQEIFEGYSFLAIKANNKYSTRIYVLKEVPQEHNKLAKYSDYYKESILLRKGMKIDLAIPNDARYIMILSSTEGHNSTPESIMLFTDDLLRDSFEDKVIENSDADSVILSHRFLHWNLGHFSNGQVPYSIITEKNYFDKLRSYHNFINTYCSDCHYLLNEYDETFAIVNGNYINTDSVLFKSNNYCMFPRSNSSGYNKLAVFGKEGLIGYQYAVFESMKGVKNSNGTLEYGTGYCLSRYSIGSDTLFVMSLHAPNNIKGYEHDALYEEIVNICSEYSNCILVGDFNRTAVSCFKVLSDAGFSVLNDGSVTYPSKGYILDWVLYRCKSITLSDFRVYNEAIDSNGDLLSDHLPLSFTVTYNILPEEE